MPSFSGGVHLRPQKSESDRNKATEGAAAEQGLEHSSPAFQAPTPSTHHSQPRNQINERILRKYLPRVSKVALCLLYFSHSTPCQTMK